jgi:hypothetical protein
MVLSQRRRSVPDAGKQTGCAVPTMVPLTLLERILGARKRVDVCFGGDALLHG